MVLLHIHHRGLKFPLQGARRVATEVVREDHARNAERDEVGLFRSFVLHLLLSDLVVTSVVAAHILTEDQIQPEGGRFS